MVEQAPELAKFNWPSEFDPKQEKIIDLGPCYLIAKPIRLPTDEKPGRDLSALTPRKPEIQQLFSLTDVYKERVHPGGIAGFHFHERKVEIIYPLAELNLYFLDLNVKKPPLSITVPERIGDTTFGFLVKPGVVHAIQNSSQEYRFYQVLANMFEEDALRNGDVKHLKFELPPPIPLQDLLQSADLLK